MDPPLEWHTVLLASFTLLVTLFVTTLLIYRLVFSPLASVPGPVIAAATGWYEFYYDCILAGKYIFEIQRMHNVYGELISHLNR